MDKVEEGRSRRSTRPGTAATSDVTPHDIRRSDQLVKIVDECIEAKRIADALGEKLLAYLLAMAIQETRAAMRTEVENAARSTDGPLPKRAPRSRRV